LAGLSELGRAGDRQAVPLALKAIEDDQATMRRAAIAVLGRLKAQEAVPALGKAAADADTPTAKAAVLALADLSSPASVAALEKLAADPEQPIRVWIAVALYRSGGKGAAERFGQLLEDTDEQIRRQTLVAVGQLDGFDATDLYIAALEDAGTKVRKAARTALSESDNPRAVEALKKNLARELDELLPLLAERDYRKQREALSQLSELGPAVAPLLLDQLEKVSPQARMSLAMTIGRLGNPEVISPVVAKLKQADLDRSQRSAHETILRGMQDKAIDAALELVGEEETAVRTSGVRLLWGQRGEAAIEALQSAMEDSDPNLRGLAAYGLAIRRDPAALEVLQAVVRDPQSGPEVLQMAMAGIGNYGAEKALPFLTKLSDELSPAARSALISALARFKEEEATDTIVELLEQQASLASACVYALQRQGTAAAARALGGLLDAENSAVRQRAQSALRSMRIPEAKKILAEAEKKAAEKKAAEEKAAGEEEEEEAEALAEPQTGGP
jgi:HEAT repeat protein